MPRYLQGASSTPPPVLWLGYVAAWIALGLAFAAMFLLRQQYSAANAANVAAQVIVPAAVLGVAVLWFAAKISSSRRGGTVIVAMHVGGSIAFPLAWIALVSAISALRSGAAPRLPPEHVIHWHLLSGFAIYFALAAVAHGFQQVSRARAIERSNQLRIVQAQLRPHFIFNTLHSVMALVRTDPAAAEEALERFSSLLRRFLRTRAEQGERISMREEFRLGEDYTALQRLRFGDRLRVSWHIGSNLEPVSVPAFLTQPLIENAIRHAMQPDAGGKIHVEARNAAAGIEIVVENDRPPGEFQQQGEGVGLRATRLRLQDCFGDLAEMRAVALPESRFRVTLRIPLETEVAS